MGLLVPGAVGAQTGQPKAHVNDVRGPDLVQSTSGLPGLSLTLDFTLLNADGQVMTNADIESATVGLANGSRYPAQVQKVDTPWSIVILVDASKTMSPFSAAPAYKAARFALADSIGQAPRGSNFAVLTFANQPKTVVDFTKEADRVADSLRKSIQAQAGSESCLNDGAYEAVTKLSGASGRRAVLIFTASGDTCGQRLTQDVVGLANQNHIQIYPVGLKGYAVTEQDLSALASPTGGLATLREQDQLVFAWENVMNVLTLQWQAKATIFPPAGKQTAQLTVTLKDATVITSDPVTFESSQEFVQPPEIAIRGQVLSIPKGLRFNLDVISPALINQLSISVVSKKTGNPVVTQSVTTLTESIEVPTENLIAGDEYTLVVVALDSKGQLLSQTAADFRFEPSAADFSITKIETPTAERREFVITVDSSNLEGVVKHTAWLVTEGNDDPVSGTRQTAPAGDPIRIPAAELQTGRYQVIVQALDNSNTALAQVASERFSYQRPSWLETTLVWFRSQPLALVAITLVCAVAAVALVAVVWLILPKPAAQPKAVEMVLPEKIRRPPQPVPEPAPARPPPRPPEPERVRPAPERVRPAPEPERPAERSLPPAPSVQLDLPAACLSGVAPADLRFSADVARSPFAIGRREGNDLVLKVDNRSGVSGHHATVTFADGHFYIEDDRSTYGTIVNDRKIPPGAPVPLEDGSVIGLGPKVKIQFRLRPCR